MSIVISVILIVMGICVLLLVHICLAGRAFRRRSSSSNMVERDSTGSTSLAHDDLDKLPCFEFKAGGKGSSNGDCAVCLDNFKMGDECRLLPICHHSFHAQCVDSWLLKNPICPICRTSINSRMGDMVSGEESSHSSNIGIELRESQSVALGTQLNSSPRLHASASETVV